MYRPRVIPTSFDPAWLQQELQNIASALQSPVDSVILNTLYAEPSRIYEGMTVKADGATWNPGGGAGVYSRIGGAWVKL